MDYMNSHSLQNTCTVLQPLIFEWNGNGGVFRPPIKFMENSKLVMNVKDTRDFYSNMSTNPDYISLISASAVKLMRRDTNAHYFSEGNQAFIEDSGLFKKPYYIELERTLRPSYTTSSEYDILMGSKETCLPLRYHTNTRKFIYVASGQIRVKMTVWKNREWLNEYNDYENYDFRSSINVWSMNNDLEDVLQFLEFDVVAGFILYIPPFWWYSIKYIELDTVLVQYTYSTFVNSIAFLSDNIRYFLQQQNITTKHTKRVTQLKDIKDADEEPATELDSEQRTNVDVESPNNDTEPSHGSGITYSTFSD